MKVSKVLVIGSNSFTGLHFVKFILSKGIKTFGISRSKLPNNKKLPFNANNNKFKLIYFLLSHENNLRLNIEFFIKEKNPLDYFPFSQYGHYNEKGYKKISEIIYEATK